MNKSVLISLISGFLLNMNCSLVDIVKNNEYSARYDDYEDKYSLDLRELDLNNISDIDKIEFDFGLDDKKRLQDLDGDLFLNLSHNNLDELPDSLSNLKNIKVLNLSNNKFMKIPNALSGLCNLESLILENNKITEIPSFISKLPDLEFIYLDGNSLKYPPCIGNLSLDSDKKGYYHFISSYCINGN